MEDPDFLGYTVFCDDIRTEVGGKFSLIGVYPSKLVVHKPFPFTLPKFGFAITYRQKITIPLKNITIKIHLPGYDEGQDEGTLGAEMEIASMPPGPGPFVMLQTNLVASGLTLKSTGHLRVRAYREGEVLKMGALTVEQSPQAQG